MKTKPDKIEAAKKRVLKQLSKAQKDIDTEGAHVSADAALAAFVSACGFPEVAEAFRAVDKRYD